jgi:hypothetical protein
MTRKTQMRTVMILIVLSSVSSPLSLGQSIPIAESPPPARTYHLLREDDDWSFLADSAERQDFWETELRAAGASAVVSKSADIAILMTKARCLSGLSDQMETHP